MDWKRIDFKKIGVVIIGLLGLWISIGLLITEPVDKNNTKRINGHYLTINKVLAKSSISYDLYITEYQDYYKIAADNAGAFFYDSFRNDMRQGQPIQIYINQPIPFMSLRRPFVVRVTANDKDYLSFDSVNAEIASEKKWGPLAVIGLVILSGCVIYKKELKAHFKYT
jgi:hypothetical protein